MSWIQVKIDAIDLKIKEELKRDGDWAKHNPEANPEEDVPMEEKYKTMSAFVVFEDDESYERALQVRHAIGITPSLTRPS
jgi:hypothetical protein